MFFLAIILYSFKLRTVGRMSTDILLLYKLNKFRQIDADLREQCQLYVCEILSALCRKTCDVPRAGAV